MQGVSSEGDPEEGSPSTPRPEEAVRGFREPRVRFSQAGSVVVQLQCPGLTFCASPETEVQFQDLNVTYLIN